MINYNDVVFIYMSGEMNYGVIMFYDVFGFLQVSVGYIGEWEEQEELFFGYQFIGYGFNSWNMVVDICWLGKSIILYWEYVCFEYIVNWFEVFDVVVD